MQGGAKIPQDELTPTTKQPSAPLNKSEDSLLLYITCVLEMFQDLAAAKLIPSWSPLTVSAPNKHQEKGKEKASAVGSNIVSAKVANASNSGSWWQVQYSDQFIVAECQSTSG